MKRSSTRQSLAAGRIASCKNQELQPHFLERSQFHDQSPNTEPGCSGQSNPKVHCISVRRCGLFHISVHDPVCRRLRIGPRCAEDNRYGSESPGIRGDFRQSRADVAIRTTTQRDGAKIIQTMVDAVYSCRSRCSGRRFSMASSGTRSISASSSRSGPPR